jgi:hypothetical protein
MKVRRPCISGRRQQDRATEIALVNAAVEITKSLAFKTQCLYHNRLN